MAPCWIPHVGYDRFAVPLLRRSTSVRHLNPPPDSCEVFDACSSTTRDFSTAHSALHHQRLIWRRLLVHHDTTLATLHGVIQTVFHWPETGAHYFVIHGTAFGRAHHPASATPGHMPLATFRLRPNERFTYVYCGVDGWPHEIRLEQVLVADPERPYPVCIGGARATPLDGSGGPASFLALRAHFSLPSVADRLLALYPAEERPDWQAERLLLRYWAGVDRFDRRAADRRLARHVAGLPSALTGSMEVRP